MDGTTTKVARNAKTRATTAIFVIPGSLAPWQQEPKQRWHPFIIATYFRGTSIHVDMDASSRYVPFPEKILKFSFAAEDQFQQNDAQRILDRLQRRMDLNVG